MDGAITGDENNQIPITEPYKRNNIRSRRNFGSCAGVEKYDDGEEECDEEVWQTLSKNFKQVQSILDQNKALIQRVDENHQSKIPDNMVENVALIREINGNISKVLGLYSDLSVNFSTMVHQRREIAAVSKGNEGGKNSNGCSSDRTQRDMDDLFEGFGWLLQDCFAIFTAPKITEEDGERESLQLQ